MQERRNIHKSSDFRKAKKMARMAAKIAMIPVVMISWAVPCGKYVGRIANAITAVLFRGMAIIFVMAVLWLKQRCYNPLTPGNN